ncbi:hypothetical protein Tco_0107206 [Tanacetum coccineum]
MVAATATVAVAMVAVVEDGGATGGRDGSVVEVVFGGGVDDNDDDIVWRWWRWMVLVDRWCATRMVVADFACPTALARRSCAEKMREMCVEVIVKMRDQ